MRRLQKCFANLAKRNSAALVSYIAAGDAAPAETVPLLRTLTAAGTDIIELGVPFSDPIADGPVIQAAYERALSYHVDLNMIFDMVSDFRQYDDKTPLVLMGYQNPIEAMGVEDFAKKAKQAGVDAVLTVDLPVEEAQESIAALSQHELDCIFLLSPTTPKERIEKICKVANGFIYYVSLKGVTGAGHIEIKDIIKQLELIRKHTRLPICVGFGIRNKNTALKIAYAAEGIVVGSALVEMIGDSELTFEERKEKVSALVDSIKTAISA